MRTAQQSTAHHGTQIVRVFNAIAQHQKRCLALVLGCCHQVVYRHVFDLAGKCRHTLMALGAGHQAQLVGVHPLHRGTRILCQCGIVSRHGRSHALSNEHGVHAGTAFQQFGHRIFAINKALVLLQRLFRATARTARPVLFFHDDFLLPLYHRKVLCTPSKRRAALWAAHRYDLKMITHLEV